MMGKFLSDCTPVTTVLSSKAENSRPSPQPSDCSVNERSSPLTKGFVNVKHELIAEIFWCLRCSLVQTCLNQISRRNHPSLVPRHKWQNVSLGACVHVWMYLRLPTHTACTNIRSRLSLFIFVSELHVFSWKNNAHIISYHACSTRQVATTTIAISTIAAIATIERSPRARGIRWVCYTYS